MPIAVFRIVNSLLNVFYVLLVARIILSWFPIRPGGIIADIIEVLYTFTEPLLAPIRKLVPPIAMGMGYMDLSPLILMLLLNFLRRMLF